MVTDQDEPPVKVDDNSILIKSLKSLIEKEKKSFPNTAASSDTQAIVMLDNCAPVLLSLNLNENQNTASKGNNVSTRLVVLTVSEDNQEVLSAIDCASHSNLLENNHLNELIEKIKKATLKANVDFKPSKDKTIKSNGAFSSLTCRELEILNLIAKGLSNKLIARELNISDGTVKVHVKHLLKKLKLKSRVEAAVWMINNMTNQPLKLK
ncbi:winged helix-turn-helix transcriptional regulator [Thalassotalea sp. M1531]|uniref:Winged helix-turn-helix transcriptional regulator n=1 Tax=Thalassotalea algicola TaxID=2716224 RepID=A0A7Y0LD26_9GAMM|nr:LuxR C-terminal-related transcriptional regulator [Thalassotalea algicola]NMP32355.1 winged helix-turn-helix transcriptional regulator [Thalassotalea algicola]